MARMYTDSDNYSDIADAIRELNGSSDTYTPTQMATAIRALARVTGVKGDAESSYRTGDVNLTPEDLGIDEEYAKLGVVSDVDEKLSVYVE